MLKNKIKIGSKEYQLKEGTYVKQKANSVVPRFSSEKLDISSLTIWNWWAQSLWHGGFNHEFIDEDPPLSFYKSENLDVYSKVGTIKRAKDLASSAFQKLNSLVMTPFSVGADRYIYIGGAAQGSQKLKLWRMTNTAPASAWGDVSGGTIIAMSEMVKDGATDPRLYLSTNPSFTANRGLKYTTAASVINDTNYDSNVSGQPTSLINAEGKLWLIGDGAFLAHYNLTTFTKVVNDPDVAGTSGQQMDYLNGDVYWIGYANSTGMLYKYDISATTDALVYKWAGFKPMFVRAFGGGKLIVGGQDLNNNAAALYEIDIGASTTSNISIKTIHLWEDADDEVSCDTGKQIGDVFFILVRGGNNGHIYVYDGEHLSRYIKYGGGSKIGTNVYIESNTGVLVVGEVSGVKYSAGNANYQASGSLESSKIDFDLMGVRKYIGGLTIELKKWPFNSYIKFKTRIDSTTHWSALPVQASLGTSGSTSLDLQLTSSNIGRKLEYYMKLSGAATKELEVNDVAVRFLMQPENKYEWFFDILLIDNIENNKRTAEQMKRDLQAELEKVVTTFVDIDGTTFDATKPGTTDRGVIIENVNFLGPHLNGKKVEYVARVHLLQG